MRSVSPPQTVPQAICGEEVSSSSSSSAAAAAAAAPVVSKAVAKAVVAAGAAGGFNPLHTLRRAQVAALGGELYMSIYRYVYIYICLRIYSLYILYVCKSF